MTAVNAVNPVANAERMLPRANPAVDVRRVEAGADSERKGILRGAGVYLASGLPATSPTRRNALVAHTNKSVLARPNQVNAYSPWGR